MEKENGVEEDHKKIQKLEQIKLDPPQKKKASQCVESNQRVETLSRRSRRRRTHYLLQNLRMNLQTTAVLLPSMEMEWFPFSVFFFFFFFFFTHFLFNLT